MVRKLVEGVYEVGAVHWDRDLFEDFTPLPEGTSYNAYFIEAGDKNVLVETVDESKLDVLLSNLERLNVEKIDYVIIDHAEQDHTGGLPFVLEKYPMAKVITNEKCKELLQLHMDIEDKRFELIADKEERKIGNKTFKFFLAPWVHWPETMFTYLVEDKIVFTGDFLGGHLTSSSLFVEDYDDALREARLYYADIIMPFKVNVRKHLKLLRELDIKYIAPTHGQVHNKPDVILSAYEDWSGDSVRNCVIIPYVSMHGSTEKIVNYLVEALVERGVNAKPYHITRTDIGALTIDIMDAATVVLASPTYIMMPHPEVIKIAYILNLLRPKTKLMGIVGSYAWATRVPEVLRDSIKNIKPEFLEPLMVKGVPKEEDYKKLDKFADQIRDKHKEFGLC